MEKKLKPKGVKEGMTLTILPSDQIKTKWPIPTEMLDRLRSQNQGKVTVQRIGVDYEPGADNSFVVLYGDRECNLLPLSLFKETTDEVTLKLTPEDVEDGTELTLLPYSASRLTMDIPQDVWEETRQAFRGKVTVRTIDLNVSLLTIAQRVGSGRDWSWPFCAFAELVEN
jgi:hypothetical protein